MAGQDSWWNRSGRPHNSGLRVVVENRCFCLVTSDILLHGQFFTVAAGQAGKKDKEDTEKGKTEAPAAAAAGSVAAAAAKQPAVAPESPQPTTVSGMSASCTASRIKLLTVALVIVRLQ